jgi:four helix bundle protein
MGRMEKNLIRTHKDLEVYQVAFKWAMQIFQQSKTFPKEERYSLTDQIRRSSRSVCSNLAEAWRKRRYEASFLSKLSDAEAEAAETQVWLEFAVQCHYLEVELGQELLTSYDNILGKLVSMINNPKPWLLPGAKQRD